MAPAPLQTLRLRLHSRPPAVRPPPAPAPRARRPAAVTCLKRIKTARRALVTTVYRTCLQSRRLRNRFRTSSTYIVHVASVLPLESQRVLVPRSLARSAALPSRSIVCLIFRAQLRTHRPSRNWGLSKCARHAVSQVGWLSEPSWERAQGYHVKPSPILEVGAR